MMGVGAPEPFIQICCQQHKNKATMRRSKSNPAKYARNYRSISQRRMTEYDHVDEEKEMERLKAILKNSEEASRQATNDDKKESKEKASRDLSCMIQVNDKKRMNRLMGRTIRRSCWDPNEKRSRRENCRN